MDFVLRASSRLALRPFTLADADDFYALTQDPSFSSFLITDYRQASAAAARAWLLANARTISDTGLGKWAAVSAESGELIGMGGLSLWEWGGETLVDITYRLHSKALGKGLGRELAQLLLRVAADRNLKNVTATITPDNTASIRLTEALGFCFDRGIELHGVATLLYRYGGGRDA